MTFRFEIGEDFARFLTSPDRAAMDWSVSVRSSKGKETPAVNCEPGEWLHMGCQVREGDHYWHLGAYDGEDPESVVIRSPSFAEPVVVPHPDSNGRLKSHALPCPYELDDVGHILGSHYFFGKPV